ncbi:MAG: sarcosine oxidase subunit gamma [Phyllobacteriaceae bacterium]|nr:sarcosine oxidase subunit gamma [Phyllobacteriaceae bacterium]
MVEIASPLGTAFKPGRHGKPDGAPGVIVCERKPATIVQVAAFSGRETAVREALVKAAGLKLNGKPGAGVVNGSRAGFGVAPGRWLIADDKEGLAGSFAKAIAHEDGAVTRLTHGRSVFRIEGPRAEWVLAKLFAVDFSPEAFPVGDAVSTTHHDVFAAIQRVGENAFDLYVFRSFARSFFETLVRAGEEVGCEVKA